MIIITKEHIRDFLRLNEFKLAGPDKIYGRMVKELTQEMPLAIIFVKSWVTGDVSED